MIANATSFNHALLAAWDTGRVTNMSHMFAGASDCNQVLPANSCHLLVMYCQTNIIRLFYCMRSSHQSSSSSSRDDDVTWLEAQLPDVLRKLVSGYVPDALVTTTTDPVERGVTFAALMVLLHDGHEQITTLVAVRPVRPLRLTEVGLQHVRRLEGPVFLYGDCEGLFEDNREHTLRLNTVDTSAVTSMRSMFRNSSFNGDLSSWDTANVTDMSYMFFIASNFDRVLPAWDTANVTDMRGMFLRAQSFNQDLPAWDTANVIDMSYMFAGATSFNQVLQAWNTGQVTDMSFMFEGASRFNQVLPAWDTKCVRDMSYMFYNASNFNQVLPTTWDTRHKETFGMFAATRTGSQHVQ
jgi:surface protein